MKIKYLIDILLKDMSLTKNNQQQMFTGLDLTSSKNKLIIEHYICHSYKQCEYGVRIKLVREEINVTALYDGS